jgi:hypothetical protein
LEIEHRRQGLSIQGFGVDQFAPPVGQHQPVPIGILMGHPLGQDPELRNVTAIERRRFRHRGGALLPETVLHRLRLHVGQRVGKRQICDDQRDEAGERERWPPLPDRDGKTEKFHAVEVLLLTVRNPPNAAFLPRM